MAGNPYLSAPARSAWASVVAFVRLGRPLFLVGGFVLFAVGAAVARRFGHAVDATVYIVGQVAVTAFQLMTHYANDYFDYEADCLNATPTRWSGGSRILADGALPRKVALWAALGFAGVGGGAVASLAARVSFVAIAGFVAIAVLAWLYSAPPLRLHSTGFGELNVALVVTTLVPFVGFALQAPGLRGLSVLLWATLPLSALQVAMLLAIEVPDAAGDRAAGKHTLYLRLGDARARRWYQALTVSPFPIATLAIVVGVPLGMAVWLWAAAPLAAWRVLSVDRDWNDPQLWERLTFWAVALLVLGSLLSLAGALWG